MSRHIVIDARIRRTSTGRYIARILDYNQDMDAENSYSVLVQPDDSWQPKAANFRRVDCPFAQFSFSPLQQIKFARQLRSLKPDLVHFPMNQQPILFGGRRV